MTLNEIGLEFGTDKSSNGHGYCEVYEKYLPKRVVSMLEIGCFKGASLLMWDKWFRYDTDIHVIDLFAEEGLATPRWCRNNNFVPHQGNQSDIKFLNKINYEYDLIIDDGSHNSYDMLVSFDFLFFHKLRPGGMYVIEDCHTCKEQFYWGREIKNFDETPLATFQHYIKTGNIVNSVIERIKSHGLHYETYIESVSIECNEQMIIIKKKL